MLADARKDRAWQMIDLQHDERSRQLFALALNRYVQTTLAEGSRLTCERVVDTDFIDTEINTDASRSQLRRRIEAEPLHQYWLAMMQIWQDLLWRYCGEVVERQLDDLVETCRPGPADRGSLRLDPALQLPTYQSAVDNHSFPGGYHTETRPNDVRQGAVYALSAEVYLLEQTGARHDYRGQTLIGHILGRFPDFTPQRILDLGCLCGASTAAYCEQFPDAEIHAIDTSAPALRFGHGMAEERGLAIHFSQQNAEVPDFDAGYFDLIVSHALFHETSYAAFPKVLGECFRLLRPGGITAHVEVPARIEVMSPWEYLRSSYEGFHNQEPFWNALTSYDWVAAADAAGFAQAAQGFQRTLADGRRDADPATFLPVGQGKLDLSNWFVMSAVKPG
ncbi:MAG: class I SAM-dependent methyltransferase [Gammaproteobacteria bacterium]|nr:class I SAM-dependent methyltransferase [Gammaproteobacteria bacterium]